MNARTLHISIFYTLIVIFGMVSCDKEPNTIDIVSYDYEEAFVYQNSQIDTFYTKGFLDLGASYNGDKLVFAYYFRQEEAYSIADDEYEQYLFFEIDPNIDKFEFENDLHEKSKLQFKDKCFGRCTGEYVSINNGILMGEKTDSITWIVSAKFSTTLGSYVKDVDLQRRYTLKN